MVFDTTKFANFLMARVKDIMLTDVPTLKKEAKVEEAAKLLADSQSGCVVIVENDVPIGIVTELDIVRKLSSSGKILKENVSKVMSSPVTLMAPKMKLDEALKIIDTKKFRKYPVVENEKLIGLASKNDIVHSISDNVKLHRNIQNVVLVLFVLFEFFVFVVYRFLYRFLVFGV